jgi:hypothetical protein
MPCQWSPSKPCQFADDHHAQLFEFGGAEYCIYHLPLTAPEKQQRLDVELWEAILQERTDFEGIQFPIPTIALVRREAAEYIALNGCVFVPDTIVTLSAGTFGFDRSEFRGQATIATRSIVQASFNDVRAHGAFTIQAPILKDGRDWRAKNWSIERASFFGPVDFTAARFKDSLSLNGTVFRAPVRFEGIELPQQTTAHDVKFLDQAIDKRFEGSYRFARQCFSGHGNRDLEGLLYSVEKRSQRKGLTAKRFTWYVSAIYDFVSEYGQNYARAFWILLASQLIAYLIYALYFGRWDSTVVAFSVGQLVRPFELFAFKAPPTDSVVGDLFAHYSPTVYLMIVSVIHSLTSIALFTLVLLALRWRFKRE